MVPNRALELLTIYRRHAPFSLSIREVHRLLVLENCLPKLLPNGGTILDVGCGDGFWWSNSRVRLRRTLEESGFRVHELSVPGLFRFSITALCEKPLL